MSTSLDKLKALTSRLEEKVEGKKETQSLFDAPKSTAIMEKNTEIEKITSTKKEEKVFVDKRKGTGRRYDDTVRTDNIVRVKELFEKLKIVEKSPDFDKVFIYKAMNLSGIGLKEDDFGEVREGKYIQVIAITYEPDKNGKKKAKNISLGYFGKAETLDTILKNEIIEFVLRWRYEKAFQNLQHYKDLIARIDMPS
jgi:hypothetical protein